ncbi:MAG: hypothetical protein VKN15_00895 [Cyanobacteriota bacterium]|nr:hypothetical protein [Cyanobacteriota bacterium]
MGQIEHALIAAAYRLANGAIPEEFHRPVDPTLDCMTQALQETCRLYGLQEQDTARFLMSLALRVGRLNSEIPERQQLREVEARLMATCGLLGGNESSLPPGQV